MQDRVYTEQSPKVVYIGGPDVSARIPLLKLLRERGFKIAAIGSNEKERVLFEKEDIPFFIYSLDRKFNFLSDAKSVLALYHILKRERFDIVHAFDTKPTIFARIAARLANVPIIIGTIPGLGSIFSEESLINSVLSRFYILLQTLASRLSDLTIFQNSDDRDFFIKKGIISISGTAIIKGSGIDTKVFSPEAVTHEAVQKIKTELGLNDKVVVTMVARLVKYKGIREYLVAATLLDSKYSNLVFLLIGPVDDTLSAFPVKEIERYKEVIRYLGIRKDIPEILFLSDMVVLPSYYREGIPRVLLEAASMEKPLITTNLPGCRDVVDDCNNGFFVPSKDANALAEAIEKLILNKNLRKEMGVLSREKAIKEFDIDIVLKKTLNLYYELLKSKERYHFEYKQY